MEGGSGGDENNRVTEDEGNGPSRGEAGNEGGVEGCSRREEEMAPREGELEKIIRNKRREGGWE